MSGGAGVSGGSDAGHPGGASRSLDAAAEVFEAERPRLVGLAYRLLGSLTDAEDVVQEAWLRWAAVDRSGIERPAAWLTTVVSRVGLDRLRARARERASYVGPWLPEPLVEPLDRAADDPPATLVPPGSVDPAEQAALADSLTTAFLVLLERLAPEERLVVLLVDVFGEPFRVAAEVTGRSEAAARQMAVRSRRKLRAAAPVADPSPGEPPTAPAEHRSATTGVRPGGADPEAVRVATALLGAVALGDVDGAMALLAPDVVLVSDGGADHHAARRPVIGPDRVTRLLVNLAKRLPAEVEIEPSLVNGEPGVVLRDAGRPRYVLAMGVGPAGLVEHVTLVVNPDKLAAVDHPPALR